MTTTRRSTDRIDPDRGPIAAGSFAVVLGALAGIGAAAFTAIGLSIACELASIIGSRYEQLLFIDGASRFAAEATGLVVLVIAYRGGRGLPAWSGRATILGLMKATAMLGLIAARFVGHFGPWLGR